MLEVIRAVARRYRRAYGLPIRRIGCDGKAIPASFLDHFPPILEARSHALQESVRWGEPYIFFMCPGVISWIAPLVDGDEVMGGLLGGEVLAEPDAFTRREVLDYFSELGAPARSVRSYVRRLRCWPLESILPAAQDLFRWIYELSQWEAETLTMNRERALQQRQIAEEIHRRKQLGRRDYPVEYERLLFSQIRAGDRRGARRSLNRILGAVFLRSPNLTIVRTLMIDLLGYLVRSAADDDPALDTLVLRHIEWVERLAHTETFEELASTLRLVFDQFMDAILAVGYGPRHPIVRQALMVVRERFRDPISLREVACELGLSSSHLAHLMKQYTGRSLLQHVLRFRILEAQRLLEESEKSCAEIAYEVGFSDQSYFAKNFRRATGFTPREYRRLRRGRDRGFSRTEERGARTRIC